METRLFVDLRETAWTGEVLSLAEAHAHLRTEGLDRDSEVAAVLAAARHALEREHGVLLRESVTCTFTIDAWPEQDLQCYLPVSPVQSITSVAYTDEAGTSQTLASTFYSLRNPTHGRSSMQFIGGMVLPVIKLRSEIVITVNAGWGVGNVPKVGKQATKLMMTTLFDESDAVPHHELFTRRASDLMQNLVSGILL